ncbi:carbohydrate kinase [Oscillospiraceae bacterium PP1C4]
MFDIAAIGELLIDFTPYGTNEHGIALFAQNPGGAPANVLAMNTCLGGSSAFIGKVGQDDFGSFLRNVLEKSKIDVTGLVMTPDVNTTLAFVQLNEYGDRSFSFYRKPGADMMLTTNEVKKDIINQCKIFHFGSVSLTDEPCRTATLDSVQFAKQQGKIISYDPNYRAPLWNNPDRAKAEISQALPLADILKVSDEEMVFLTGETVLEKGAVKLAAYGPSVVLVSLGCKGAFYYVNSGFGTLRTYDVEAIDTTGAGDAFFGAVLYQLREMNLEMLKALSQSEWEDIIDFANAAGSLTTTQKGAIPAMPALHAIEKCRRTVPLLK